MRFVKPLDEAPDPGPGPGSRPAGDPGGERHRRRCRQRGRRIPVRARRPGAVIHLGLPDRYLEHAEQSVQLAACGLDPAGITARVRTELDRSGPGPSCARARRSDEPGGRPGRAPSPAALVPVLLALVLVLVPTTLCRWHWAATPNAPIRTCWVPAPSTRYPPAGSIFAHYDRGWFSSRANAELALQPPVGRIPSRGPAHPDRQPHRAGPARLVQPRRASRRLARVHTRVEWVDTPGATAAARSSPPTSAPTAAALARLLVPAIEQPGVDDAYRLRSARTDRPGPLSPRHPAHWRSRSTSPPSS